MSGNNLPFCFTILRNRWHTRDRLQLAIRTDGEIQCHRQTQVLVVMNTGIFAEGGKACRHIHCTEYVKSRNTSWFLITDADTRAGLLCVACYAEGIKLNFALATKQWWYAPPLHGCYTPPYYVAKVKRVSRLV